MKIAYANVHVSSLEQSVAFFVEKIGLTLAFSDTEHGYASFAAGPISLGLAVASEEHADLVGRPTGIGFAVDDLEAEHARLSALGVAFPSPPERQPWGGFMGLFADPDGNTYYLDEVSAAHG
jgi:predicted enzyme related to lactoylglutathione lyase